MRVDLTKAVRAALGKRAQLLSAARAHRTGGSSRAVRRRWHRARLLDDGVRYADPTTGRIAATRRSTSTVCRSMTTSGAFQLSDPERKLPAPSAGEPVLAITPSVPGAAVAADVAPLGGLVSAPRNHSPPGYDLRRISARQRAGSTAAPTFALGNFALRRDSPRIAPCNSHACGNSCRADPGDRTGGLSLPIHAGRQLFGSALTALTARSGRSGERLWGPCWLVKPGTAALPVRRIFALAARTCTSALGINA